MDIIMKSISAIESYAPTTYKNNSEPDLDEDNLNKTEQALKRVTDAVNEAINALKQLEQEKISVSDISNVQLNDQYKVPSSALAYAMKAEIDAQNRNLQINVDNTEHIESVYSLFKNNLSDVGPFKKAKNTVYHFRIGGDADPTFGNGHFVGYIMADGENSVFTALIVSKWTGDVWSMIFTNYDQTNFIKKLS